MRKTIVYAVIALVIILIGFGVVKIFDIGGYKFNKIDLTEYVNLNKSTGKHLIYVYDDSTKENKEYTKVVKEVMAGKDTKVNALDYAKLTTNEDKEKVKSANFYINQSLKDDNITVPMIIYIEDGKMRGGFMGTTEKANVEKFVKDNGIK